MVPQNLSLCSLTRRHPQHQVENLFPHLLHRPVAIRDRAGVDVHVVRHPPIHRGIARYLNNRHRREPNRRTPARRKHNQITTTRRQTRQRRRIITRSIHKVEPRRRNPLRVPDRRRQRGIPRLRHCPQRLLEDVRQPTFFIPGRRIIVKAASLKLPQILLIGRDPTQQILSHLAIP